MGIYLKHQFTGYIGGALDGPGSILHRIVIVKEGHANNHICWKNPVSFAPCFVLLTVLYLDLLLPLCITFWTALDSLFMFQLVLFY